MTEEFYHYITSPKWRVHRHDNRDGSYHVVGIAKTKEDAFMQAGAYILHNPCRFFTFEVAYYNEPYGEMGVEEKFNESEILEFLKVTEEDYDFCCDAIHNNLLI